jgi:polysaccharide pyruvyl transferase WcaK-like protein
MGGYGFGNIGDEAQLSACIATIQESGAQMTIFTPNVELSRETHGSYYYTEASRTCLFLEKRLPFYRAAMPRSATPKELFKFLMIFPMFLIGWFFLFNVFLYRAGIRKVFFYRFISELARLDQLHFSGGGYFTGKTFSRLVDFCFVIRACRMLAVDITMSGQTVGMWNYPVIRPFVENTIKTIKAISLRDRGKSKVSLLGVISDAKIEEICDDAYGYQFREFLPNNISLSKFIVLHFHDWGHQGNSVYHQRIIDSFSKISSSLLQQGFGVSVISMTPSDDNLMKKFVTENPRAKVYLSNSSMDERISLFRDCSGVVTMKHHPIIFALRYSKPVICMYDSEYYHQKNIGALQCVGINDSIYPLDIVSEKGFWNLMEFPYGFETKWEDEVQRFVSDRDAWFRSNVL